MPVGDVNSETVGSAARYNDGKPDFSLVPLVALEECAKVFDYGRKKYSEWNWAKGQDWSHPYASLMRHLSSWQQGEDIDPESGLPHLGHAMCNMVMLCTFAKTYPQGDNRPNKRYFIHPKGETSEGLEKEVTPIESRTPVGGLVAGSIIHSDGIPGGYRLLTQGSEQIANPRQRTLFEQLDDGN